MLSCVPHAVPPKRRYNNKQAQVRQQRTPTSKPRHKIGYTNMQTQPAAKKGYTSSKHTQPAAKKKGTPASTPRPAAARAQRRGRTHLDRAAVDLVVLHLRDRSLAQLRGSKPEEVKEKKEKSTTASRNRNTINLPANGRMLSFAHQSDVNTNQHPRRALTLSNLKPGVQRSNMHACVRVRSGGGIKRAECTGVPRFHIYVLQSQQGRRKPTP